MGDLGCKHFNGVRNEICRAGVRYQDVEVHKTIPCFGEICTCRKFETRTKEELEEINQEIRLKVTQFLDMLLGKSDICVHCGKKIESTVKIGRCVIASPCGCRLYQS